MTEHHFPVLFYFTSFPPPISSDHTQPLSWSSLHMQRGCSFSLQHRAKTQHVISYLRQEEEDWHGLVEFSFPDAYWKHAKCCFSEHCCTLQNLVCICGSEDFACSTLPQNDSPALALTAISFICFSFSLCHTNLQIREKLPETSVDAVPNAAACACVPAVSP